MACEMISGRPPKLRRAVGLQQPGAGFDGVFHIFDAAAAAGGAQHKVGAESHQAAFAHHDGAVVIQLFRQINHFFAGVRAHGAYLQQVVQQQAWFAEFALLGDERVYLVAHAFHGRYVLISYHLDDDDAVFVEPYAVHMAIVAKGAPGVHIAYAFCYDTKMAQGEIDADSGVRAASNSSVMYELDLATGDIRWSDALYTAFHYERSEPFDRVQWWVQHIHPDDTMILNDAMDRIADPSQPGWEVEYRFRNGDGEYMVVKDRASIIRDADGTVASIIGTITPVFAV